MVVSRVCRVAVVALVLVASSVPVTGAERMRSCKIKFLVGSVKVRRGKQIKWQDAKVNMRLRPKDAIRTMVESRVEIETEEGSIIKLEENSTMEMSRITEDPKNKSQDTKVRVMSGKLWANVKKMTNTRSNFAFETPTATAAIRGTQLGLEVDKKGTLLKVYRGAVQMIPAGGGRSAMVKANQMAFVKKGQRGVKVQKLEEKDKGTDTTAVDSTAGTTAADSAADTTTVDTTATDTTQTGAAADTQAVAEPKPLVLSVLAPNNGDVFLTQAEILVSGMSTPGAEIKVRGVSATVDNKGAFSATIRSPATPGEYSLTVEATLAGESKSETRAFAVKTPPKKLTLVVNTPTEGETYQTTSIPVSGITLPGATVTVGGAGVPASGGNFNYTFSIPDEAGDYEVVIEASVEGETPITVTRTITYQPPKVDLMLRVISPANGAVLNTPRVSVQGQTNAREVLVNGNAAVVVNEGFTYNLMISETRNWDLSQIEVVANTEDGQTQEEIIQVTVDHTSPAVNTSAPLLTAVLPRGDATTLAKVPISILDNTPNDEVIFTSAVDGDEQTETYGGKDKLVFDLLEGKHKYEFWAFDMARNRSNKVVWEGSLIAKRPSIYLRNPISDRLTLTIPQSPPGREFTPRYTIEFEVKDLPGDEPWELLREVKVANPSANYVESMNSFSDLDFTFDVDLKRGVVNTILITVTDKADNVLQKPVVITIRK